MVIAIDGPAGVGKSSISSELSRQTGFHYLNSGNFYRAVTYSALSEQIDLTQQNVVEAYAASMDFSYKDGQIYLKGKDITHQLHSDKVDAQVAQVSSFRGVRQWVNQRLREISHRRDIIVEGRDIATVVFPDADLKVFLDASPEVRAKRRFDQGVSGLSLEEIAEGIRNRDAIDRSKEWGRLVRSEDALYVDTSGLTIEEVCAKVVRKIQEMQR
ncbi:(d)CMP kinase [Marispirochaeta sp.]|jgi:cytidylate kinase|uniref:(d)CMP kinase n=1 Tax=Marispirochaeta sp. TaxID=2038653 RepID=UPI0029C62B3B|nr:(d)CMP kinase [Marispirochaeta sp.]